MVEEAEAEKFNESLAAAYRQAEYLVTLNSNKLTFRIGRPSEALRVLLQSRGVTSACFVTAANPASERQAQWVNARAREELVAEVEQMDYTWLPGVSRDPIGAWPDEESLLVLGPDAQAARQLGERFGQLAVVLINDAGMPELLWTSKENGLP